MTDAPTTQTLEWSPCDPLGEVLQHLRMSGLFYCRSELTAPWGATLPPMADTFLFHVVLSGRCWLDVPDAAPCELRPGAFALIPHGAGHRVVSDLDATCVDLFAIERTELSERYEVLHYGGGGEHTSIICGAVRFAHPGASQLVKMLPSLIHVEEWDPIEDAWVQSTLKLLAAEASHMRPGGDALITRLSDVLVIQTLRWWMDTNPKAKEGWLGAMQDPRIGRAMAMVHRHPEQDWTVASLASEVAMSRSGFAAQFAALVGESPMRYLARWRMQVAWDRLREEAGLSLGDLASQLGYQSEAAFSRAFKRFMGISPGAARRQHSP